MSIRDSRYDTYFEELREVLGASSGRCKEMVIRIPDFLDLFVELLRETEKVGKEERGLMNAAIAYTLAPYDVNPEKNHEGGKMKVLKRIPIYARRRINKIRKTEVYIDDAFLCSEVLTRLRGDVEEKLVNSCWKGEEDVFELAEEANEELEKELDEETRIAIITYAGLNE